MKYLLFYKLNDGMSVQLQTYLKPHRERINEFHRMGTLLMSGAMENAEVNGAVAVFTTREAAEKFASGDPFVLHGVVSGWRLLGWHEVLLP